MKRIVLVVLTCFLAIFPGKATAEVEGEETMLSIKAQTFNNENCATDNTCDLKSFWITADKHRIVIGGGHHYGTSLKAGYRTESVESLGKYALVQFIRGCVFSSSADSNGLVSRRFDTSKEQFGKNILFHFPDWVIDSIDKDPVYNSNPDGNRHDYYRWDNKNTGTLYGTKKSSSPELYVMDYPQGAYFMDGVAYNTSLELKMCIYRTSDVPKETVQEDINFTEPIACFYWSGSFVYNHRENIFEISDKMDPVCRNVN